MSSATSPAEPAPAEPSPAEPAPAEPAAAEPAGSPAGIDRHRVDLWLLAQLPEAVGPFAYELIAGGRSNLTYRVTDSAAHAYVLRRPPLGHLLPSAHDMAREYRIISALGATNVPVANARAFTEDPAVSDRPFYVMDFADGLILRTIEDANQFPAERRRTVTESLIDVLGDLHALDVDKVGLGELGKREGYIARQLHRWHSQFTASKLREVPEVDAVHQTLSARIPMQQGVSVVHGDYRLDNTIVNQDGDVVAVLDWEICTLGDPLADLGVLLMYSPEPSDPNPPLGNAPTMAEGFLSQHEMLQRYEKRCGLDVSNIDFYLAFAYWKLACIIDGVYTRYKTGAMGNDGFDFEHFNDQVTNLARRAEAVLQ